MNQPAKLSKTGITGWRRVTASDLRTSTENSPFIAMTLKAEFVRNAVAAPHGTKKYWSARWPSWLRRNRGDTERVELVSLTARLEGNHLFWSSSSSLRPSLN